MEIVEVNQSRVYLVTFGSGKTWYPALQRLKHQAIRSKRFGKIFLYDENDLNFNLTENDFDFYKSNPRGYGMWIWKALIIRNMLSMYPDCEIVLYLDSGCEINSSTNALEKLDSYIATVRQDGGLAFELPFVEENWTSDFVIDDMKARDLALTRQLAGGIFFIKNSISYHSFLNSWITWMKKQTGVDGFRWDAVKHFPTYIQEDYSYNLKYTLPTWAKGNQSMFNVGEWVGSKTELDNYVNSIAAPSG